MNRQTGFNERALDFSTRLIKMENTLTNHLPTAISTHLTKMRNTLNGRLLTRLASGSSCWNTISKTVIQFVP